MSDTQSDFQRLGEDALKAIIEDFVTRLYGDLMIGYMFKRAPKARIVRFEYEHAASFLGAGIEYGGRPLGKAHAGHRIQGGQFMRRLQVLKNTLKDHKVPEDIAARWVAHHESLRDEVTQQPGSDCD